jgi:hypothetical protein
MRSRPVADAVRGEGVQQSGVEAVELVAATVGHSGLKRRQRSNRAFEADRARRDVLFRSGLGHHRANQIVRQQVRPDFAMRHVRRFATQVVQMHALLERTQVEFRRLAS